MSVADIGGPALPPRQAAPGRLTAVLAVFLVCIALASLSFGAAQGSPWVILRGLLAGAEPAGMDWVVVTGIRLPRLVLCALVGAALAVSGAVMQGLFRNPLADPGIVGVTAGASLGAISAIVLGGMLPAGFAALFGSGLVAVAAFAGSWTTTWLLYRIATRAGRTSVATMLLAGIALGALTFALSGVMIYLADDRQLRDLTFWSMGSMSGATWGKLLTAAPLMLAALAVAPLLARGLNALALGEAAAFHLGQRVQRLKTVAILCVAAATGAAVAVSGGIGFVGIVVPHLLRLISGPDHRRLLPNAALLGAALLLAADMVARTIVAPAELPIGIVTAVFGGPFFLWVLLRRRGLVDL